MDSMLESMTPIAFGVLTTETFAQAEARAGGPHGNKGYDAARSAVEMAQFMRETGER
jgi:6,7-dimethyl-8-ribityllumazine synthase